jgi:Flp pilus assembly protein TadB
MKSESDPIAEADVYLAYGRSAQAIEIFQQGIKEQPACVAAFQAELSELENTDTKAPIGKKIPKVFFVPILAGVILYFVSLSVKGFPAWSGWLVLFGTAIGYAFLAP